MKPAALLPARQVSEQQGSGAWQGSAAAGGRLRSGSQKFVLARKKRLFIFFFLSALDMWVSRWGAGLKPGHRGTWAQGLSLPLGRVLWPQMRCHRLPSCPADHPMLLVCPPSTAYLGF